MRRFFLIELVVSAQGWWTWRRRPDGLDEGELSWMRFWRLAAATLTAESVLGLGVYSFLRAHGQV